MILTWTSFSTMNCNQLYNFSQVLLRIMINVLFEYKEKNGASSRNIVRHIKKSSRQRRRSCVIAHERNLVHSGREHQ